MVALGLTTASQLAAANPAGAAGGFAGLGMAETVSSNVVTARSLANAMKGNTAGNAQTITGPETCPFCGTPLSSQTVLDRCPACDADIRSYYSAQ